MQKRIRDASSGTKAFRDAARGRLLEEMAKLIYHGATVDRASELAAYASHGDYPFRFKASTLIKAYAKDRDRLTRFATEVCGGDHLTKDEAEAIAAGWRAIINQPLVVSPEIKGEVR
jgi:hypothetical protein